MEIVVIQLKANVINYDYTGTIIYKIMSQRIAEEEEYHMCILISSNLLHCRQKKLT